MISLYDISITQFKKSLQNLDKWLEAAAAFADKKKFDANTLLAARLAPDQLPFSKQVQIACDQAKFTAARLTGKQPPSNPDTETTLAELRTRVATTLAYLDTYKPEDFNGAEERKVPLFGQKDKGMRGLDYLRERQIANFYFHVVTTYAILRHNGVDLGKADYIGQVAMVDM
ncbi:MAG TPA: DUF1993 domain-containing protein [Polyangiaceae bacterium]|jgi:hypothetical protein